MTKSDTTGVYKDIIIRCNNIIIRIYISAGRGGGLVQLDEEHRHGPHVRRQPQHVPQLLHGGGGGGGGGGKQTPAAAANDGWGLG